MNFRIKLKQFQWQHAFTRFQNFWKGETFGHNLIQRNQLNNYPSSFLTNLVDIKNNYKTFC